MSRVLLLVAAVVACLTGVSGATIAWVPVTVTQSWVGRSSATAAVCNDALYLTGGLSFSGSTFLRNDVQRLDVGSGGWAQETAASPWTAREQAQMVTISATQMILMGGQDAIGAVNQLNDVWLADCSTAGSALQWSQLPTAGWAARDTFAALQWRNKLWVLGGFVSYSVRNDVWSLPLGGDLSVASWTRETASAAWPARYGFGAVVFDDALYVMGGAGQGGYRNDVWRLSDPAGNWTQLEAAPCSPRYKFQVGVAMHRLVMAGGTSDLGSRTDSCSFNGSAWQTDSAPATSGGMSSVARMPSWQAQLWWLGAGAQNKPYVTASSASNATSSWPAATSDSSSSTALAGRSSTAAAGQSSTAAAAASSGSNFNAVSSTGSGCAASTCSADGGRSELSVGWMQAAALIALICASAI